MEFIDLNRQYNEIKDEINHNINKVLDDKKFIMGPEVSELENKLSKYTGRKYVFTCASGTDALVISLMSFNLEKTDAVFVPSFTFFASAESINLAGGTPVFVDSSEDYNIDVALLEKQIENTICEGKLKPRGIIAVDLFGLPADYNKLKAIADKYNLFLIEDAAQSFGAKYYSNKTCSFGDISTTSFFPAKPLGCYGDGGAIFTDNDELAKLIKSIRIHGQGKNRYDNVRIGINGRMDTIQAAILLAKLKIFDEELMSRNRIAEKYKEKLGEYFSIPKAIENVTSSWAQFTLLADSEEERNFIINEMNRYNIPIMIYYAKPLHLQTAYKYLGYQKGMLPICENMSNHVFSIPMHPYLSEQEIDIICKRLITLKGRM